MSYFKVKHIAVKQDGTVVFRTTGFMEVVKNEHGYINQYCDEMQPLFDVETGDLVGFIEKPMESIDVEFEED